MTERRSVGSVTVARGSVFFGSSREARVVACRPMRSSTWITTALLVATAFAGCGPDERNGNGGGDGGNGNGDGGGNQDGCSDAAKLVYVVDSNNKLSTWDGATKTFSDLGTLNCPAEFLASPFSMSIDRTATAWVLYSSGELFKVNTSTLECTATSWTNANLVLFGMGFSTDAVGGSTDTLYIAGGRLTADRFTWARCAELHEQLYGRIHGGR